MKLTLVTDIEKRWPEVENFIARGCAEHGNRYTANDCKNELLSGAKQLWIPEDHKVRGYVISGIIHFPSKTVGMIDSLSGNDFNLWCHLITVIEDWMRLRGCAQSLVLGRLGLWPFMKQSGYCRTHYAFEKDL